MPHAGQQYSDDRWQWYAGADEERLRVGPHATREDAIEEAVSNQEYQELDPDDEHPEWRVSIYICQCVRPEVRDMVVDADRVLEDLDSLYEDFAYEEALFESVTKEQSADLSDKLTAALHDWAARHGFTFPSWCFQESRHCETVILPHPIPVDRSELR